MAVSAQRFLSSRARWILFGLIVAVAVYLLAVTPVRTYFDQRSQMGEANDRYALLADANKKLNERAAQLQTDEEIARLARERYELVPEGKEAYAVMPAPPDAVQQPPQTEQNDGLWDEVWDTATFWN